MVRLVSGIFVTIQFIVSVLVSEIFGRINRIIKSSEYRYLNNIRYLRIAALLLLFFFFIRSILYKDIPLPLFITSDSLNIAMSSVPDDADIINVERLIQDVVKVEGKGVGRILSDFNINEKQSRIIVANLNKFYNGAINNRVIKVNRVCTMKYMPIAAYKNSTTLPLPMIKKDICHITFLSTINMFGKMMTLERVAGNIMESIITNAKFITKHNIVNGVVSSNMYGDMVKSGLREGIINNVINAHKGDINFNKNIKHGDKFKVIVENYVNEDGAIIKPSVVLYSQITVRGKLSKRYHLDGLFYDENGDRKVYGKFVMPVHNAVISSPFGHRKHPIFGYRSFHEGVDLAVPSGTKIYASSDGVIVSVARSTTYGNMIDIKHNNEYKTRYAHMSHFHKTSIVGQKVKAGDVIGYVGSTGMSTGPHLHFEVLRYNRAINPMMQAFARTIRINGKDKIAFQKLKSDVSKL